MKKILVLTGLMFVAADNAHAANLAVITNGETMFSLAALIGSLAGVFGATQVLSLIKGGRLSRSWQMMLLGLSILALSQITSLLEQFEIVALPGFTVPAILLVATGLLVYGIFEARKTLG